MKTSFFISFFVVTLFTNVLFSQSSFKVTIEGKGKPVLLLPGFGCTGQVWAETVAKISKTHKCYIFTYAGFGGVPAIESPWFATLKSDLENYIIQNKLEKSTLIGHSIGGTLSLWLAADHADWFGKLILVDALPASAALMIPNYKGEKIPYDNPQSKSMMEMTVDAFEKMNHQQVQYMCNNKEKQELIASWMNQTDRKTYVRGYIDMLNLDLRADISKITSPVYILAATNPSLEVVTKTYADQYKNLPAVKVFYAEKSAHFVMFDQPEWFLNQVTKILN
jgi:pimeloyl-ACP methyl ester carboxylesterase